MLTQGNAFMYCKVTHLLSDVFHYMGIEVSIENLGQRQYKMY